MIITCERCATRFKVPDDKLAGGPVRMRCSKCNHVFLTGPAVAESTVPAAVGVPAPHVSLPPSFAATLPPVPANVPAPLTPAPVFGAPRAPSHDPFSSIGVALARPGPFSTETSAPPQSAAPDPFAGLGSPTPAPTRPVSDPFAGLQPSSPPTAAPPSSRSDPFAGLAAGKVPSFGTPMPTAPTPAPVSRKVTSDPFAGLGLTSATPLPSTAPRAATNDPFAAVGRQPAPAPVIVDPFAAVTSSPPAMRPHADPFSAPTSNASANPFGAPNVTRSDPFGPAAAGPSPDPFGASGMPSSDPFAAAMSQPPYPAVDPFALVTAPLRPAPVDPFANDAPTADPFRVPSVPTPMPTPPDDEEDSFGRLDDVGASYDADARSALFGMSSPAATPSPQAFGPATPSAQPSGLELATPIAAPAAKASTLATTRLLPFLRTALHVLQVLLFVVFVVVAVVLGRGGSPLALLSGDLGGAFDPMPTETGTVRVDHVDVAWRTGNDGFAMVVVTGIVHHGGDSALPAVVVEVSADGTVIGRGYAWSDIDAFATAAVASADDVAALQARRPASPRVAPGDDAPFVVVAAAPGASAAIAVVVRTNP